jgi:ATP-dependent helicase/DNAse subunit B
MSAVFLLCGPVGSGKTHALLARYHERSAAGIGAALWLAPTERARDALRPLLLGPRGACLAPHLQTFPDFARQVARAAEPTARPLPELHQRLLLDDVLADLARRGELSHFAAVADSRGFADAVFGLLTELKGQGISPAAFTRTAAQLAGGNGRRRGGRAREKDRQIARAYARYQKRLHDRHLLDREATYARARELWAANRPGPFAAVRAVFVDSFADFTPPQLDLLEAVAGAVNEVWIALVTDRDGDDARGELFARPLATLARLQRLRADQRYLIRSDAGPTEPPARPAGLTHLERQLFRPEPAAPPSADAAGLTVAEAPGLLGEVRITARAVKTLLLDSAAADDILVTARDLSPYADLVREVLAEYGVPLDLEGTDPLARCPAVATLLRAVRLADDGFPFAGTTALLRNSYFRPRWPEVEADPAVVEHAEALLRLLGEPRGREAYLRAVLLWATEPPPGLEDEQAEESRRLHKHQLAQRCQAFLERFFRMWDRQPARADLAGHADWLRRFADDTGLACEAERTDAAAWDRFWAELDGWAGQERHLHPRPPAYPRAAFHRLLGTLAAAVGVPRTSRGPGRVRVLPAEQARHLDCEYLFLLGLGERGFPDLAASEPLFDDAERQAFRQAGLELRCAGDRLPDEMLLFFQLVTRPRRRLVLSYPAVDEKGQSLLPSSFLTAVTDCFTQGAVPVERQRMLIEGYERVRPLSPAEYRVRWAIEGNSPSPPAPLPQSRERVEPLSPLSRLCGRRARGENLSDDLFAHLRAAAELARQRFHSRAYSPYDGLLRQSGVLADLRERFGPDKVLSPTALESYVACPFRFFLEQVLKVEPLEDPGEEVEHTRRGAAVHRALSRLHHRLKADEIHAPTPELDDRLVAELRGAVEEYAGRVSSPAAQALWRLEGRRLERAAARYRLHWEKFQAPWNEHALTPQPHVFEAEFGLGEGAPAGPLVIRVDGVEVRIGGRIDRIDITNLPDGGVGFWVIDYKTGRSAYYAGGDLVAMRRLQLSLYALAVERVLLADARPLGLAYWLVADAGPKLALPAGRSATAWLTVAGQWPKFRAQLEAWVATLVAHIRRGEFPLKPRSEHCTDSCPYGQVCRIAQSRHVEKDWELPLPNQSDE